MYATTSSRHAPPHVCSSNALNSFIFVLAKTCALPCPLIEQQNLDFEVHEWTKHGVCAGVQDAADFFTQVCTLAVQPLAIMNSTKAAGGNLNDMATAVENAGYEVWSIDTSNSQLELSVCAGQDGRWLFADQSTFPKYCGS